jgi:hypothetical protein
MKMQGIAQAVQRPVGSMHIAQPAKKEKTQNIEPHTVFPLVLQGSRTPEHFSTSPAVEVCEQRLLSTAPRPLVYLFPQT